MNDKTRIIVRMAKEKSNTKFLAVLNALCLLIETEEKITFYGVAKKSGVSRNFLYTNREARELIEKFRSMDLNSLDNLQDVIHGLKIRAAKLERENQNLRKL